MDVQRGCYLQTFLAVLEPSGHILSDVGLVFATKHDIHTWNLSDFLSLELGITARHNHQGIRILADEVSDVLSALAVGQGGHTTRIHHAHVRNIAFSNRDKSLFGE